MQLRHAQPCVPPCRLPRRRAAQSQMTRLAARTLISATMTTGSTPAGGPAAAPLATRLGPRGAPAGHRGDRFWEILSSGFSSRSMMMCLVPRGVPAGPVGYPSVGWEGPIESVPCFSGDVLDECRRIIGSFWQAAASPVVPASSLISRCNKDVLLHVSTAWVSSPDTSHELGA